MNSIPTLSSCPPCRWFSRAVKNTMAAWRGRVYELPLSRKERLGRGVLGLGEYLFPFNALVFLADKYVFHPCLTHKFKLGENEDPAISRLQEMSVLQLIKPQPIELSPEDDDEYMEVKEIVEEFKPINQLRPRLVHINKPSHTKLFIAVSLAASAVLYWMWKNREMPPVTLDPINIPAEVIRVEVPAPPCPPPAVTKVYEKIVIPKNIYVPIAPEKSVCPLVSSSPFVIVKHLPAPPPITNEIEKIVYVNQTVPEARFYEIEDWKNRNEVILVAMFISAFILPRLCRCFS